MKIFVVLGSGLLVLFGIVASNPAEAQCINSSEQGVVAVSAHESGRVTATSCASVDQYSTFEGLREGDAYIFTHSSLSSDGYITLTDTANTVLAHGPSPLMYRPASSGDVRLHYSNDASCTPNPEGCRTGRAVTRVADFFTDRFEPSSGPPVVTRVTVSPVPALTTVPLSCVATMAGPQDDGLSLTYLWTVGDVVVGDASELEASAYARGDTVRCRVTASDGEQISAPVSDEVTIANSPPVVLNVSLTPTPAFTNTTLTCSASMSDADGDAVVPSYLWAVNDALVSTGSSLPSSAFFRGDSVRCTVTPFDGSDQGEPLSAETVIANSPPVVFGVAIQPSAPNSSDTLTCSASATDVDGDSVSLSYVWTIDGTTAGTGSTLPASALSRDQSVRCTVTPFDGIDSGAAGNAEVIIRNSPPVVTSVSIAPAPATSNDTLICTATVLDPDDDPVTLSYVWTVDGETVGSSSTLPPSAFVRGDQVRCTVTPFDGIEEGLPDFREVIIVDG